MVGPVWLSLTLLLGTSQDVTWKVPSAWGMSAPPVRNMCMSHTLHQRTERMRLTKTVPRIRNTTAAEKMTR